VESFSTNVVLLRKQSVFGDRRNLGLASLIDKAEFVPWDLKDWKGILESTVRYALYSFM
jgi:hypothetical protein